MSGRWRVERAAVGTGWLAISPEGLGYPRTTWRKAYRFALMCAGGRP